MLKYSNYINRVNKLFNIKQENVRNEYQNIIVKSINSNKITTITWIKNIWKTSTIIDIIQKTKSQEKTIYINKDYDLENVLKNDEDILELIDNNKSSKYIILSNLNNIIWIKNIITYIIKESDKKLIIIWNDIKIKWANEIDIKVKPYNSKIENNNLLSNLTNTKNKEILINYIKNDIINKKIYELKLVKNHFLYNLIITFLSKNEEIMSIREIHRYINDIEKISLKTMMDYLNFSEQEKIIQKVNLYDFKKQRIIEWKQIYYFTDTQIRNSFYNFELSENIILKNNIFVLLNYYNYKIYTWKSGVKDIEFLWEKNNKKIIIHISKNKNRTELQKEINFLEKIENIEKIYLIVNNIENLKLRKYNYNNIEIISENHLLKKSL